jgi:threonyl-tRNA synthetase
MKFDLSYIDKDGSKKTPVVLHRAILGSIDRAMAFYLEETKGNLPLWLAPVQIAVLPVNNDFHLDYSNDLAKKLKDAGLRVEVNDKDEKLSYRMREVQVKKIPLTLIIGDKEIGSDNISYRKFGSQETFTVSYKEFIQKINDCINNKEQNL